MYMRAQTLTKVYEKYMYYILNISWDIDTLFTEKTFSMRPNFISFKSQKLIINISQVLKDTTRLEIVYTLKYIFKKFLECATKS